MRYWLKQQGLATSTTGGGDVTIKPTAPNSAAVLEFKSGQIAGASEPSPYDVEMVQDGGKVLLSEPGVTTVLMVTQSFLSAHPAVVADLLKANLDALSYIKSDPSGAEEAANAELAAYTGKPLSSKVLAPAFKEITFTADPDAASLTQDAQQATAVGLLKTVNLNGIFDLDPLNVDPHRGRAAGGERRITAAPGPGPAAGAGGPGHGSDSSRRDYGAFHVHHNGNGDGGGHPGRRLQDVRARRLRRPRPRPGVPHRRAGRVHLPHRRVRLRQVHPAVARGRP